MEQETGARIETLPRNVKLLGWASCLNDIASEMIYPLMPRFLIEVLGGNKTYLGIIEGAVESISSLLKLASGAWSDRAGQRKKFIVFGYTVAAIARPLIALAAAPWHLFVARIVDRIGKGVRTAPRDAIIADSTRPELRGTAFGFHRSMDHLGAAIGPLMAAVFLWFWPDQLRLLFGLTLVPGILVVALIVAGLREPRRTVPIDQRQPRLSQSPLDHQFRLYLISLVVFTLGNSSDAFLLVRAGELGVAPVQLPLLWFTFHVVKSLGSLLGGRLVDRWGAKPPLIVGWFLYAAVYLAFAWATTAWHVWGLFLAYAIHYALTESAEKTLVTKIVGAQRKGLAFGWYNLAIGISALPASAIFGWLYQNHGPLISFGWGAVMALVAVLLLTGVRERRPATD